MIEGRFRADRHQNFLDVSINRGFLSKGFSGPLSGFGRVDARQVFELGGLSLGPDFWKLSFRYVDPYILLGCFPKNEMNYKISASMV